MSKKAAPNPLLLRLRYSNPLPPPPFPPKLLHIPTDPARYAGYSFLAALENEREIPVIADAEGGMPIELGIEADGTYGQGAYWEGNRTVVSGNTEDPPQLDPEDLALLADPTPAHSAATGLLNGASGGSFTGSQPGAGVYKGKTEVSWLRRTEYFGDASTKARGDLLPQKRYQEAVKRTREERLAIIESTFTAAQCPLSELKHPTKPHLTAVTSLPLLPDDHLWPNAYQIVRFSENPLESQDGSGVAPAGADAMLEAAIIRPIAVRGEARFSYYLPRDGESASEHKLRRLQSKHIDEEGVEEAPMEEDQQLLLDHVRDYEAKDEAQARANVSHSLLVLDESSATRPPGAYYANINNFRTLRKRRRAAREDPKRYDETDPNLAFYDGYAIKMQAPESGFVFDRWLGTRVIMSNALKGIKEEGDSDDDQQDANGEPEEEMVEA